MKKSLLLVVALVLVSFSFAIAVDNGPAQINLKEVWTPETATQGSVTFDHQLHQTNNTCTDCHATEAGGKFKPEGAIKGMNASNAAHKLCWDCHTTKKVPEGKKCTKCHTGAK